MMTNNSKNILQMKIKVKVTSNKNQCYCRIFSIPIQYNIILIILIINDSNRDKTLNSLIYSFFHISTDSIQSSMKNLKFCFEINFYSENFFYINIIFPL